MKRYRLTAVLIIGAMVAISPAHAVSPVKLADQTATTGKLTPAVLAALKNVTSICAGYLKK